MRISPKSLSFTILLGALAALPPLSIDMGLPAFPAITKALNTSPSLVGLTLSLFMAGFATAQLIFGPLCDRYGRRPILIIGCLLFTIAGAACAMAPSIGTLIAFRLLQGAGAGMVMTLSIVRDLFEGPAARAQLSYVNLVTGVAPIIAPTIGSLLLSIASWRTIYAILAIAGLLLSVFVSIGLSESLANRDLNAIKPRRLVNNYGRVLRNPICLGYALVNALSFSCMFTYVAGSPLIFINIFKVSTTTYGWLFASTAFGIMAGSLLNGNLSMRRVSPTKILTFALLTAIVSAVALTVISLSGAAQVITLLPLLIINTFCMGLIVPNAIHGAISPLPEIAGVASATVGFLQMLSGALASALVSFFYDGRTPIAMSSLMAMFAISSYLVYIGLVRSVERRLIRDSAGAID